MEIKRCIKSVVPRGIWEKTADTLYRSLPIKSLSLALQEQELAVLHGQLTKIVPDLSRQYTATTIIDPLYVEKLRCLHAFQIELAQDALKRLEKKDACVVDIGDSAGTHLKYLKNLPGSESINTVSVNLDPTAIEKIKALGFNAMLCSAEDLHKHNVFADILLSYEMLEHIIDPISFLAKMARSTPARFFVISVPYVRHSRVGLWPIRSGKKVPFGPEGTHIFELSPDDWKHVFALAGWKVVKERVYLQYPLRSLFRFMKSYWTHKDYEGFYGVILEKDMTWHNLYDWPT
jgi:SAM-dependent methyltransferase